MIYKCLDCEHYFDEDEIVEEHTTYESYYGVATSFGDSNPMTLYKCPCCDSDQIDDDISERDIIDNLNTLNDKRETIRILKRDYKNIYDEIMKKRGFSKWF